MQTDEERQNALQAFSAQSTFSGSGSGSSMGPLPSPTSHSESRPKVRKGPRKNQNEKYRLKYMRLRKAARAIVFVSKIYLSFYIKNYGGRESSTRCNFRKHMQIEKARANQENIFIILTADGANAHNQIHFICSAFLYWLCCEHLQHVRCQIDESVFLICRCFFYLQHVSFLGCVVSICSVCVVKLRKLFP